MLKLHHHPLSTYARRVTIAILEKSIDVELIACDMANGTHRQPPFLAMNPYGRVPVLQDGDFLLYESAAILEYLEERFPQPALQPNHQQDRARMRMHMRLADSEMAANTGIIIFPKRFIPKEKWRLEEMATAKKKLQRHLHILNTHLQDKTYLVAEQFTLADLCYVPFVHFLPLMELEAPANVAPWLERIAARPSSRQTAPPM